MSRRSIVVVSILVAVILAAAVGIAKAQTLPVCETAAALR